jgi:hypothetical protein
MKYYVLFFLLLPFACFAQVTITGKVINAADNKPVPSASVFLSNATVGSKTADDGTFTLNYVKPGQYEFVVSVIGFDTYRQKVMAGNEQISLAEIKLTPKTKELKEVTVDASNDWEANYRRFQTEFIGTSTAAEDTKITNSDPLTLDYDKDSLKLTGSANDFLEVENKYLGYKIKYLLKNFDKSYRTGMLYFEGSSLFQDLPGSLSQKRRWQKRRKEMYEGSSMHFLRMLLADSAEQAGFVVYRLTRKPNPKYFPGGLNGNGNKFIETLSKKPIKPSEFLHPTELPGIFAIGISDILYVKYTKSARGTILNINGPYAFFDSNGIFINPADVIFEGFWGRYRVAELLPVDYEPPAIK